MDALGTKRLHDVATSVDLDGIAGHIRLDDLAPHFASTPLSVTVWTRYDGTAAPGVVIYAINPSNGSNLLIWRKAPGNTYLDVYGVSSAPAITRSKTTSFVGTGWHHVGLTWDVGGDDRLRCYVDGSLEFASNGAFTPSKAANDFHTVGGEVDSGPSWGDFWHGLVAQVGIYNRTLSAAEIAGIYGKGYPTEEAAACALYQPGHDGDRFPAVVDGGPLGINGQAVGIDASDVSAETP